MLRLHCLYQGLRVSFNFPRVAAVKDGKRHRTAAMTQESYSDLERRLAQALLELSEAREQQRVTSEVLRVISNSAGELEPLFQAMCSKRQTGEPKMSPRMKIVRSSVRKVCQLTGEMDRETGQPAFNLTESRFDFFGTDLGSSFEHGGRLWFLFGDTWPGPHPVNDSDCVAWTTDTKPEPGIHLEFVNDRGKYRAPKLRDRNGSPLKTGAFEVPIAGFSANNQIYLFHSTDRIDGEGGDGGLDVFWIGPDGGVGTTWANPRVDSGNWHSPFPIAPPGAARVDSPIAAVTRLDGALDVFWIGPDGGVGTTWPTPALTPATGIRHSQSLHQEPHVSTLLRWLEINT
jgi:Domain of unknown function (DUF4185)